MVTHSSESTDGRTGGRSVETSLSSLVHHRVAVGDTHYISHVYQTNKGQSHQPTSLFSVHCCKVTVILRILHPIAPLSVHSGTLMVTWDLACVL